ncbi:MAG: ATP-binding protein [Planctomycetota bacterium]|nr:ATP-binding protein [Planctomycetota bacterium]
MICSTRLSWQIGYRIVTAIALGQLVCLYILGQQHARTLELAIDENLRSTIERLTTEWREIHGPSDPDRASVLLANAGRWLPSDAWISVVGGDGTILQATVPALLRDRLSTTTGIQKKPVNGRTTVKIDDDSARLTFWVLTRPLSAKAEPPVWVQVGMPANPWLNLMYGSRRNLGILTVGLGLFVAAVVFSLLERRLAPLKVLTATAAQTARGEMVEVLQLNTANELEDMAHSLNELQGKLTRGAQELYVSGLRQETVLSAMMDGVIAVDRDKTILFVNSAVSQLLELPAAPRVGRPLLESVRVHGIHQLISRALASGASQQTEIQLDAAVPHVLSLHVTCMPGTPSPGVVIVLHDVTDVRRLERLRQDFVANVSHELKTPLSSIKAYAETLRTGAIHDQANCMKFLLRIEEHADRLDALIVDLLRLARIESGEKSFEIQCVNVRSLVHHRVADHQALAHSKQIELSVTDGDPLLHVRADEEGFRQILDNLIDNAIKYTSEHGKVTLRWFCTEAMVSIEVEDTGIGISPEDQKRVFERFYRVDKARSRDVGGTGLGLAIVKHVAQFFGGQAYVHSEVRVGSTFGVRLPMTQPTELSTA